MTNVQRFSRVLDTLLQRSIQGEVDGDSQVVGRVEIREGAKVENSIVRGPVSIGEGCHIKNSLIGPFTSIGPGTVVDESSVEHSVILERSGIHHIERLEDSLVGNGVEIRRGKERFKGVRLFVGCDSTLEL